MATTARGYTSSAFLLELDGKPVGYAVDASGGQPVAEVIDEPADASGLIKKHLGDVTIEPIVLRVRLGMASPMYDWIATVPARGQVAHDGAVVFVDHNYRETARLAWTGGLISEVVFPPLDATSKEQASIVVTILPMSARYTRSAGGAVQSSFAASAKSKKFLPSNFRVSIDGLPSFSTRISKVSAISVRQDLTREEGALQLGAVHVGDVEMTGPEAWSSDLRAWFDDFVVGGRNEDKYERSVVVEVLEPAQKDALYTVRLGQVGIYALTESRSEATSTAIAKVTAELYCEELSVAFDPLAVGAPAAPAPTPTPAAPSAPPTAEATTAETFFGAWRDGLRLARPALSLEAVASRLRRPVEAPPALPELSTRQEDGRRFGAVWAREIATLEELESVTGLAGQEWTTATLPDDHSLLWALERAGETADPDVTRLAGDPFIRGVVDGAAAVRRELEGQLGE
jgi:hypothetical protein